MKPFTWLKIFSLTSFIILIVVAAFNLYVDPYKNLNQSWRMDFVSDRNGRYSKLLRMKKAVESQVLILGSSRSELIYPEDVESITGLKTYTSAMGGAYTYTQYAFGIEGLAHLPKLEEVWFVSDFFEFNQKTIPWMLYELEEFNHYFADSKYDPVKPSSGRKLKSLISWEQTRQSIKTVSDFLRDKPRHYLDDGSTKTSQTRRDFKSLEAEINKIKHFYTRDNWNNYKELSTLSKNMIEDLIDMSLNSGVEFKVFLTPIHPKLYNYLSSQPNLEKLWMQWREFWQKLAKTKSIKVYDFTESQNYIGDDGEFWNDGVHFSRESSKIFIKNMSGE